MSVSVGYESSRLLTPHLLTVLAREAVTHFVILSRLMSTALGIRYSVVGNKARMGLAYLVVISNLGNLRAVG